MVHITEEDPKEELFDLGRPSLDYSIYSAVVPQEEGVDRFIDKEDEDTPLTILPSDSRGITVTEADISTLRREGIAVDDNNKTFPENFMHYDDVLPTPSSLTFGFHVVSPWSHSGNFPVGRDKLKMNPNPRIQHMSCLDFFMKFYFMGYIKDLVIPETNKFLNSAMNLSEYFCLIGCRLIMGFYVGHSVRDLFLKDPITPPKSTPIRLNHIISGRRL